MKRYILGFVFLAAAFFAKAQYPVLWNYSTEEGLPSSLVYGCTEDSEGYMWFATDRGIARFDGYNFKRFQHSDNLPGNDVWGVEQDKEGILWFSTFNNPFYFENGKFKRVVIPEGGPGLGIISAYWFDTAGNRYVGDKNVQYILERREGEFHLVPTKNKHYIIGTDSSGITTDFIARAGGMLEVREKRGEEILKISKIQLEDFGNYIITDNSIKTDNGYVFPGQKKFVTYYSGELKVQNWDDFLPESAVILGLHNLEPNRLGLKTDKGFFIFDENFNTIPGFEFLNNFKLNFIYRDSKENIWLCTKDKGIYFLSKSGFHEKSYAFFSGDQSNNIINLTTDSQGNLWFATEDGRVFQFDEKEPREIVLDFPPLSDRKRILGFNFTKDGALILGGDNGLAILSTEKSEKLKVSFKQILRDKTNEILENRFYNYVVKSSIVESEDLYIGHRVGTMLLKKSDDKYEVTQLDSSSNATYALASIPGKGVWIGKKDGIYLWEHGMSKSKHMGDIHPAFRLQINALATDSEGSLWIATDGTGFFRYDGKHTEEIPEMVNKIPKSIFIDKEKHEIWVSHNEGISCISPLKGDSFKYNYKLINQTHGLISNEVNSVLKKGNDVVVGTKEGLTVLNYDSIFNQSAAPPLRISEIKINNQSVPIAGDYRLKPHENNISVSFVCLSFKGAKNIVYEYQMEGLDNEWFTTPDLKKEYSTLPAGIYAFKVRAIDIDGTETLTQTINFTIKAVWWKRYWAIALFILTVAGGVYALFKYRVRVLNEKNRKEKEIAKRFAELELNALQAQMNPHFISNALTSIQSFISQKDHKTATKYLIRFSRLMRLFLESSKNKYISVEEEIKLLTFYIELEHMRFPDKFEYSIETGGLEERADLGIPTMLIQPFVENAITHGLLKKNSRGKLLVKMKRRGDFLEVLVEDDGIGRKAAEALREEKIDGHKSRGTELVEDRLDILNLLRDSKISIDIEDKISKNGRAKGTKVLLKLPIQKNVQLK